MRFIAGVGMGIDILTGQVVRRGPLYTPVLIWLYGLPVWMIGLVLSWPIAAFSLRKGKAGPLTAIAAGLIIGGLVSYAIMPKMDISFGIFGAIIGMIFAAFFWIGTYRRTRVLINQDG